MIYLNGKKTILKHSYTYYIILDNKSANTSNCKFYFGFYQFCHSYKYNIISLWIYHGKNVQINYY